MKVTILAAVALAQHLFELELDIITNDTEEHFQLNDWTNKYGEQSIHLAGHLTSSPDNEFNAVAIQELAKEIQEDFASGHWSIGSCDEGLYNYMMPTQYGGIITKAFEKQLAMLTGAGIQQELNFA